MADTSSKVGVEFVVKGLATLKSALAEGSKGLNAFRLAAISVKHGLEEIKPKAGLLERAFVSLGRTIKDFAQNILKRILVITLGVLVRDAIRKVIDVFNDMVRSVIEGGDAFQRLEIRLNRLNMNALKESGMSASEALKNSIALTKEQIMWSVELSGLTIYDAQDITNAYTLARSYDFVDETARQLTERILDFSSGMGLTGVHIERIIANLGQMVQQGKITGTELRDLARGSFVPVNKVLKVLAEEMGITTEELNKMRKAGTTDPQWFIQAFMELMGEDFAGATMDMAKSFTGAMANIKDIFIGTMSALVTSPVMSTLGEKISSFVNAFYNGKKLKPDFLNSFMRIGESISNIINKIFNLLPGVNSVADTVIAGLKGIADWLETNEDSIVSWVKNAMVFLQGMAIVIKNDVIPAISTFFKWVYNNREVIGELAITIGVVWLKLQLMNIVIRAVIGALIWLVGIAIKVSTAFLGWKAFIGILQVLGVSIGALILPALLIMTALAIMAVKIGYWIGRLLEWFQGLKDGFTKTDWSSLGVLLIEGIKLGLQLSAPGLYALVAFIAKSVSYIWNSIFDMHSPSKVMYEAGMNITEGLVDGITAGAKEVIGVTSALANVMSDTLAGTSATASTITSGATTSTTSDYLSNTGEVMRRKLDTTAGGDPCAKGTAASCAAEKVASALGGIGSSLVSVLEETGTQLKEIVRGYAIEDLKNASELYDTGKQELQRMVDVMTASYISDPFDRFKERQELAAGGVVELTNYATEDLKNKSTLYATGISEINRVNTEAAKGSARAAITGISDAQTKATQSLMQNNNTFNYFMNKSFDAFLNKLNTLGGNSPNTYSIPPKSRGTSVTSTTNVTNNFGKGTSKGSQVTFDYESSKFWM